MWSTTFDFELYTIYCIYTYIDSISTMKTDVYRFSIDNDRRFVDVRAYAANSINDRHEYLCSWLRTAYGT